MQVHKQKWIDDSIKAFTKLIETIELNELDKMLFTVTELDAIKDRMPVLTKPSDDKNVMRIRASRLKLFDYIWKGESIGWLHFESLDRDDF